MIHYLWWIPSVIVTYVAIAWVSKQSQELGGIYFWLLAVVPIPLWAFVTRVSSNLLIDGLIYDILIMTSFSGGLLLLGVSSGFAVHQYIGLVIAIAGIILMKV
jgi:hypothetical protein